MGRRAAGVARVASMQNLSETENLVLGSAAAFVEAVVLQPTIYWKNAAQQGLPFTLSPRILYRGLGAALTNEMGQMGLQFGVTGFLKKLTMSSADEGSDSASEMMSALLGGALVAPFATVVECTMIQQQRFGGSLPGTMMRVSQQYGVSGLLRGFTPVAIRDAIYV